MLVVQNEIKHNLHKDRGYFLVELRILSKCFDKLETSFPFRHFIVVLMHSLLYLDGGYIRYCIYSQALNSTDKCFVQDSCANSFYALLAWSVKGACCDREKAKNLRILIWIYFQKTRSREDLSPYNQYTKATRRAGQAGMELFNKNV